MTSKLIYHPKPLYGESLANYIYRLANLNSCNIKWITEDCNVTFPVNIDLINECSTEKLLLKLTKLTGLSREELVTLTLERFTNGLPGSKYYWSSTYCKCCPLCLKKVNYHRIYWHIDYIWMCLEHNTLLYDRCLCGELITAADVINGECHTCGKRFDELSPIYSDTPKMYLNQVRIYSAFKLLSCKEQVTSDTNYLLNYSRYTFLVLYHELIKLSEFQENHIETYSQFSHGLGSSSILKSIPIIESILEDWPTNYYNILDVLNNELILFNRSIEENAYIKKRILINPLFCISGFVNDDFLEAFQSQLIQYNISKFHQFNKELLGLMMNERYFSMESLEKILQISSGELTSLFNVKLIDGEEYIKITDVIRLLYKILTKCSLYVDSHKSDYISLVESYQYFYKSDCSLKDIIEAIIHSKINACIKLTESGFKMFYVHKNSIIKTFL